MSHLARCLMLLPLLGIPAWTAANDTGTDVSKPRVVAPLANRPSAPTSGRGRLPIQFTRAERTGAEATQPSNPLAPSVARQSAVSVSAAAGAERPLPLSPRSKPRQPSQPGVDRPTAGGALTTAVGSLGIVLAVFFLFVWVSRRTAPKGLSPLPAEAVESLGRAPLVGRQQVQLIRVGRKLILLTVTPGEARTLTEITDPAEVDRLAGLCQQHRPGSITTTFRHVLAHCASERTPPEPLAGAGRLPSGRAAGRGTRRSRSREDSHD